MALRDRTHSEPATGATAGEPQESSTPSCEECGAEFGAAAVKRPQKRYCSPRCRSRAHYREHRPARLDKLEVDSVPLSPREAAMMAESAEDIARGDLLTHEEVLAQLAALRERA